MKIQNGTSEQTRVKMILENIEDIKMDILFINGVRNEEDVNEIIGKLLLCAKDDVKHEFCTMEGFDTDLALEHINETKEGDSPVVYDMGVDAQNYFEEQRKNQLSLLY